MAKELSEKEIREQLDLAGWDLKAFPLYFYLTPEQDQLDLIIKYKGALADFREFMKTVYAGDEEDWEETNFGDFSTGFFIAKGASVEDAFALSSFTRYGFQDFDTDPDINPKAK